MKTKSELTFKHNIDLGRHGWLRLTPAYSVKVVESILHDHHDLKNVLDPFSGTGTTGLVCCDYGLNCDLLDINPFLVWFGRIKTTNFDSAQIQELKEVISIIPQQVQNLKGDFWTPAIKNIDRWWTKDTVAVLSHLHYVVQHLDLQFASTRDLLLIAFCRTLITVSNAAFNHQSMSFKETPQQRLFEENAQEIAILQFSQDAKLILRTIEHRLTGHVNIRNADARTIPQPTFEPYDCVITSPPYPNRMSYIRELRPYMYWLGYLDEAKEAGELDWQAIGGTWGIATSRTAKWGPSEVEVPYKGFYELIADISQSSQVLANYVHKYFVDILTHVQSLNHRVTHNGKLFYIVGNSKFYDTLVPVEEIYASIFRNCGFGKTNVTALRKRNSKKELVEYMVYAEKA